MSGSGVGAPPNDGYPTLLTYGFAGFGKANFSMPTVPAINRDNNNKHRHKLVFIAWDSLQLIDLSRDRNYTPVCAVLELKVLSNTR